ncbi:hypothetical protein ACIRJR_10575 [Streptomyces sp. NPDC102402]|uniref:hypothetical protein n=1 Tax=Streptomyces sp. NPDC102402 TaxID=3366169 RepID=UPI0038026131
MDRLAGSGRETHLGAAPSTPLRPLDGPFRALRAPPGPPLSHPRNRVLAPGGHLALNCFASGAMGSELPDAELYGTAELHGGLAYTPESLRQIFAGLEEVELHRMQDEPDESPWFGKDFLWSVLLRKPEGAGPLSR